jgi:glycosyltransferase involved in cell wall biosynthesis
MRPIYINGRFAEQSLSGVQRFATEITTALQRDSTLRPQLLAPKDAKDIIPGIIRVGTRSGQAWEQWDLRNHAKNGYLVNLGNTAPILAHRQLVVIHDTGVFSTPNAYSWRFRAWYKFLQRALLLRKADIVTVSQFSKSEIIKNLGASPGQVAVIPEGADHIARIDTDDSVLAAHGLQAGQFVLIVGNLSAHKNLPALNVLAKTLAERGIPLVITGSMGNAVFKPNGQSLLPDPARYVGRVSDEQLKTLYTAAACFVFPSLYEGYGLPVVEAMACGCPVVAADIQALRETAGDAAIYCNPQSPQHIADQVTALIDNAAERARLRSAGVAHVQTMTWQRAADALSAIIQQHQGQES